ncbi:H-NS family nucleoid-associated regulatory protein [Lysobacter capsici]|uniref:H-NS family nucleoid-associated regulatory protein n=1 Tax=Lysobacter capsici TaxID=435897 RepID=UPI001BFFF2C2|nr:H-NS family nucleoid-associated regulatory protein [Lysobacter capsici]QWF18163.1 H-NS histone family protein [Lysobacter capsici]
MALTSIQSINAEIKQLEAQKKLVEKRDSEVPKAIEILQRYAKVLTPAQRRKLTKIAGDELGAQGRQASAGAKRPRKIGTVAPKFRLPTGETWTGRGRTPIAFAAWEKGAEGKAWRKANEGGRFPAINGTSVKAPTSAASTKASRGAAKKIGKKAAKKAARPAKKAAGQ